MVEQRPPLPPFTRQTAILKVRAAEDGWNSCDPQRVSLACTPDVVVQAPAPARLIEGGIPTEATVAQDLVSKYTDHLPLYRQARKSTRGRGSNSTARFLQPVPSIPSGVVLPLQRPRGVVLMCVATVGMAIRLI